MQLHLPHGVVDLDRARFEPEEGAPVRLSTREVAMLTFLSEHAGQDVSRDDLLTEVWGYHELTMSRAVDTAVSRLRKKIEPDPSAPEVLCTAHGEGYRLVLSTPGPLPVVTSVESPPLLDLGDRSVDLGAGLVRNGAVTTALSGQERQLLLALADRPGIVVDPERLARLAGVSGGRPALANAVYRVRSKIEPDPSDPRWLVSIRNQGYRLDASPVRPRTTLGALRETLWSVAETVGSLLGLDDCVVYARDGNFLVQAAAHGEKAPARGEVAAPIALRIGEGIVGHAARSGRPQVIRDVANDPRYVADLAPARSELAVPIMRDGDVVGVIDSESRRQAAYGDTHLSVFRSLADIAAAASRDVGLAMAS